jgi:mannosyl-oligosaccharide alpha-1,2-mannosidase
MQDWEVVDQILAYVQTIDFDTAIGDVSLFETTIRYLGGLLSGQFTAGSSLAPVSL